ncbi:hypothetical protein PoB_002433700 [Plakobranchus ocellatus]|uniref:Secreted protein n=1 Tax=Plakobranchus ocellatus TaxID=259542 RepID=A0AAV3ZRR3_9GAST|nr:hypothetical protein PoB_002433700 [Plakobranchus ocellatus]
MRRKRGSSNLVLSLQFLAILMRGEIEGIVHQPVFITLALLFHVVSLARSHSCKQCLLVTGSPPSAYTHCLAHPSGTKLREEHRAREVDRKRVVGGRLGDGRRRGV